jgi:molybdopterin-binding protein
VAIGKTSLIAEMSLETFDEMNLSAGSTAYVIVKLRRLRYFESL